MRRENQISTDRQVAGLKPAGKPYEVSVSEARGLSIRVFPDGTRLFEFRYGALGGKRRRLQLGPYPGLSLAAARQEAQRVRVAVVRGDDPAAQRAAAKEAARTGETMAELSAAYFLAASKGLHGGRHRPKRDSTIVGEKRLWRDYIEPKLGDRRFAEIRRPDVKGFMRTLATDSGLAPASVATVGGVLSNILGFAVYEDRIEANPALGLTRPIGWSSRERRFGDDAVARLWTTLVTHSTPRKKDEQRDDEISRLAPQTCLALRFALTTLSRRTETAAGRWAEVDRISKVWNIPGDRVKTGNSLVIPLSAPALAILDAAAALPGASGEWIFPSPSDPSQHIDEHGMTRAIARLCVRLEIPHGSTHDFRRTGASVLTSRGVSRHVVGCILGHKSSGVISVYDRHSYLPEKRAALAAWAAYVLAIAAGESTDNVVDLRMASGA